MLLSRPIGVTRGGAVHPPPPRWLQYKANLLGLRVLDPAVISIMHQIIKKYAIFRRYTNATKNFREGVSSDNLDSETTPTSAPSQQKCWLRL